MWLKDFESSFCLAWNRVAGGDVRSPLSCLAELMTAYCEPQRAYHTLQHLGECLALFQEYRGLAENADCVELALWFHDGVYDPRAGDNEVRSGVWGRSALEGAGASPEDGERIYDLILATDHRRRLLSGDQRLIVDLDLAILGADGERFSEYEAQIRVEYGWVPEEIFREKRAEILEGFLGRDTIYHHRDVRKRFEAKARNNLAVALEGLRRQ